MTANRGWQQCNPAAAPAGTTGGSTAGSRGGRGAGEAGTRQGWSQKLKWLGPSIPVHIEAEDELPAAAAGLQGVKELQVHLQCVMCSPDVVWDGSKLVRGVQAYGRWLRDPSSITPLELKSHRLPTVLLH